MFYKVKLKDHVRVPPTLFGIEVKEAVVQRLKRKYEGYISKDFGMVIDIAGIEQINDGVIIPGDGASYYDSTFEVLTFKPELQEVVLGRIRDIADFGAFISLGPIEGMIHISQSMDDFVSFSKDKVLMGKDTKKDQKSSYARQCQRGHAACAGERRVLQGTLDRAVRQKAYAERALLLR